MRRLRPGIPAVLLAVAIVVVAVVITTSSRGGTYELSATFDDVRGLIVGGDVRAGAVNVGTVAEVEIGPGDRPVVTMEVEEDFPVHHGASADIRLASNLGAVNRTVELTQGNESAPRLPDGAQLSSRRTDQPVNIDEALETLDRPTRRNLGRILGGLDAAVRRRGPDIDRMLRHSGPALATTAELLAQVNSDGEALRTLVADGRRVTGALASRRQDLGPTAERVAGLLRATAANRSELRASVRELGPALAAGRRTLDALAQATPKLRRLAVAIGPAVDELGRLARVLPDATKAAGPLLTQTRKLVEEGPAQLREFRPIAQAATPVARKLEPVARQALPLARVLQIYVPETVGAFQNFGATAGSYDANGHVLNVAANIIPVPPDSVLAASQLGGDECDASSPSRVKPGPLRKPFTRAPGVNECQPWTDLPEAGVTGTGKAEVQ